MIAIAIMPVGCLEKGIGDRLGLGPRTLDRAKLSPHWNR